MITKFIRPKAHLIKESTDFGKTCYALARNYPRDGNDVVSKWIKTMKDGNLYYAMAFGVYAGFLIKDEAECECIVRALEHDELHADTKSITGLDAMGKEISEITGWIYDNTILSKKRVTSRLADLNRPLRQEALGGNYFCTKIPKYRNILVIDDITTSGITLENIYKAIIEVRPGAKISFLVIGKSVGRPPEKQVAFDYDAFNANLEICRHLDIL